MNTTITADDLEIDVSEMSDDGVASVMAQKEKRIAELEAIVTEAHRERNAAQARAGAYLYRAEQAEAACDAVIEDARALAQRINDMGDFWDWQTKESDIEIAKKYLTEETK